MAATSHDVARMAGVSQSTVSRALRGEAGMSANTRQRIEDAARALSYVPDETGRSLSTRATRRIGVVADELTNPFYPELIEPLRTELERAQYRTLLIPDHAESPVEFERLVDGSLDGIVLTTATLGSSLPHSLAARGIPYVMVNREVDGIDADVCVTDNHGGALQVARLIVDLGHRSVGAVLGPVNTSTSRDREAGLRQGLSEHGVALRASAVRRGPFTYATGRAATLELLNLSEPPTAIFCANDVLALGALNGAASQGVCVGSDLTVIGFDDIAAADWDLLQLTTVRCELATLARDAVNLLTNRIRQPNRTSERLIRPAELVLRQTHSRNAR